MSAGSDVNGTLVPTAAGVALALIGVAFVGVGVWGRRETRRALARERIEDPAGTERDVTTASAARSAAELIRRNTLAATGDRTYSEIEPYLDVEGKPTSATASAATDERTGRPVENPDHDLWIQSTTLQAALLQAYMAFRLSDLTAGLGVGFVVAGLGLAATGRR